MPGEPIESTELLKVWEERPDVIRRFLKERPQYEQLCAEMAYILQKRLSEAGIEFSAVIHRAKSLESFAEKIIRKEYKDPFTEITDVAGVRVVYLYTSDFPKIEQIISSEFAVIEKVDKIKEQGAEKFGYGAIHFVVTLGQKSSGARYDDLKGLKCEIQVRTVSQDAWAIIDHHLEYKQESSVPEILRRKLNRLSAFFEDADETFDRIRAEREEYLRQIESKLNKKKEFLDQEINLDTVRAFLKWKFPDKVIESYEGQLSQLLGIISIKKYPKLEHIDKVLSSTTEARKAFFEELDFSSSAASELLTAMMLYDPSLRPRSGSKKAYSFLEYLQLFNKYDHLVKR